jgi:DNA-binding transcriptional regulator YiaG
VRDLGRILKTIGAIMRDKFIPKLPTPSGDEVKALRIGLKLNRRQFADMLQVSVSSIEAWEYSRTGIPAPVWKLANILKDQSC